MLHLQEGFRSFESVTPSEEACTLHLALVMDISQSSFTPPDRESWPVLVPTLGRRQAPGSWYPGSLPGGCENSSVTSNYHVDSHVTQLLILAH